MSDNTPSPDEQHAIEMSLGDFLATYAGLDPSDPDLSSVETHLVDVAKQVNMDLHMAFRMLPEGVNKTKLMRHVLATRQIVICLNHHDEKQPPAESV